LKNAIIAALIAVLLPIATLAQGKEQTSFCDGGSLEGFHSTALPKDVVKALMNTEEGEAALESAEREDGKELDTSKWFLWAKPHLADSRDVFYLVMSVSPMMSGADNTWFWIVRQSGKKATILLWAGGNCVGISRSRTSGYRDVRTTWSSPNETITKIYTL
jgi:hypothetical protein